jgi:hypothetical protein
MLTRAVLCHTDPLVDPTVDAGSVKDQREPMSTIKRSRVKPQPEPESQRSSGAIHGHL